MTNPIIIDMVNRISTDRPDVLCRGDIFGIQYNDMGFVQKKIVEYQTVREHNGLPYDLISHVGIVSVGQAWRGYEMQPPRGNYVDILDSYKNARIHIFRAIWPDDITRLKAVDEAIYLSNSLYSWYGCARFYVGFLPTIPLRFCSKHIVQACRTYGMDFVAGVDDDDVTPARLCASPLLTHVATINT